MKKLTILSLMMAMLLLTTTVLAANNIMFDSIDFGSNGTEDGRTISSWGRSATDETGGNYGGIGNGGCRIVWDPRHDGNTNYATFNLNTPKGSAQSLKVRHLVGNADDSFTVNVMNANGSWVEVGAFTDDVGGENWQVSQFDLSLSDFGRGRDLKFKITATGDSWAHIDGWGQLCIDWVELYGNGKPR